MSSFRKIEQNIKHFFPNGCRHVIGWGREESGRRAVEVSTQVNKPFMLLADGFICSSGCSGEESPKFSIVKDGMGIYYDSLTSSWLESRLNSKERFYDSQIVRAEELIANIVLYGISKYNDSIALPEDSGFIDPEKTNILIAAQPKDSKSLIHGQGHAFSGEDIVRAAIEENKGAEIYLKLHPDVIKQNKESDIDLESLPDSVHVIAENYNPIRLLKHFDKVYTKTSHIGIEALMLGIDVVCFGTPFYAGWGLTDDRVLNPHRVKKRSLNELVHAAYVEYSYYGNPYTGESIEVEDVVRFVMDVNHQKALIEKSALKKVC